MASLTFWSAPAADLLAQIDATPNGLQSAEAQRRLLRYGPNTLGARKRTDTFTLLLRQFKSPIILILVFAAALSLFLHDRVDAGIILGIVLVSGLLGFWQERGATDAVEKLLAIVQVKATVLRDGRSVDIPVEEVVPGDIVLLNAGDIVPGDCLLLESNELFADEATLTGETYRVEKQPGTLPTDTPLAKRTNSLFMGTHVVSGSSIAVSWRRSSRRRKENAGWFLSIAITERITTIAVITIAEAARVVPANGRGAARSWAIFSAASAATDT